ERALVLAREKLDARVALDRIGEVRDDAVERHGDSGLGERGRNALRNIEARDAVGIFPTCTVGEGQRNHGCVLLTPAYERRRGGFARLVTAQRLYRVHSGLPVG